MPRAKIVIESDPEKTLQELVRQGIISSTSCKGTRVYGRHYLTKQQVRRAYMRAVSDDKS